MSPFRLSIVLAFLLAGHGLASAQTSKQQQQLAKWLERFPDADADGNGVLTLKEAAAYRRQRPKLEPPADRQTAGRKAAGRQRGVPREFNVDAGWQADRFPDHAVCYLPPETIAAIYAKARGVKGESVTSFAKPSDGSLRIVGTGHSFMAPGYKTLPLIARAAGFQQQGLFTHTGGGITGSTRYKWEQENGIFDFDGKPTPKLLASIANAEWDAMMWGPYFNDHPNYYACWIDFCLKHNPDMKFYLSDAWPQLEQLKTPPTSKDELTAELFRRLGRERDVRNAELIDSLNKSYPGKVFVLPTSEAMILAVEHFCRDELPGVEGIHKLIGKKERSLWKDRLGHLGTGFGNLEGYVFYATLYGRSPELIEGNVPFGGSSGYPSEKLDRVFRKIAWQAVLNNELSGIQDENGNGVADDREKSVVKK